MKLSVNDISFSYGAIPILDQISFQVDKGAIFGLLGPNGAGKSTMLRVLNGQLQLKSGDISIENNNISDMTVRQIARNIATVPQNPKAIFGFTVRQIVTMGRRPHHSIMSSLAKKDIEIVDQALCDCGLQHLAERPITELSGGEAQLTFVARALAQKTETLLLDEATSNLDINHTTTILSIIKQRAAKGLTVISVVHDLNTAIAFCDKIAFISDGKLIGPATTQELITTEIISNVYKTKPGSIKIHKDPFFVESHLS